MSRDFIKRHRFQLIPLPIPRAVEMADGRKGHLTHYVEFELEIDRYKETITYYVGLKLNYLLILGLP